MYSIPHENHDFIPECMVFYCVNMEESVLLYGILVNQIISCCSNYCTHCMNTNTFLESIYSQFHLLIYILYKIIINIILFEFATI